MRFTSLLLPVLASCTAAEQPSAGGSGGANPPQEAGRGGASQSGSGPRLARMLAAIAPYEADQQPCIAKNPLGPDFSPEQRRRSRIVWSDSLELQRRIRRAHEGRILHMGPDVTNGPDAARFVVRVTGSTPLPPYRLGGRARDVPVVIEYDMPYSADELQRKVEAGRSALLRLLPEAQGWGVGNGFGLGALFIHVHSPTGRPPANLSRLCEQLVEAVGMPVLLTFTAGRMAAGPAPAAPPARR
jgi:hypothetical protein